MSHHPKFARGLDGRQVPLDEHGMPPPGVPVYLDTPRLSRTPASTFDLDPDDIDARDPRPLRQLTSQETPEPGCWLALAAFENWRGSDGYFYVDVLAVSESPEAAYEIGTPVGPLEPDDRKGLRMAGDQLVMRMSDPMGRSLSR